MLGSSNCGSFTSSISCLVLDAAQIVVIVKIHRAVGANKAKALAPPDSRLHPFLDTYPIVGGGTAHLPRGVLEYVQARGVAVTTTDEDGDGPVGRRQRADDDGGRAIAQPSKRRREGKGAAWIKKKKEQARARGKDTARDSKYTGRKRKERI